MSHPLNEKNSRRGLAACNYRGTVVTVVLGPYLPVVQ